LTYSLEPVLEYKKERSQTYYIAIYLSRSIFSALSNSSLEALSLSFSGKSKEESMGSDLRMSTIPKVTISKISFKKTSLKLSTAFSTLIPEE